MTRWCKCCKRDRPADSFFEPNRKGWKCNFCGECSRRNMHSYWAGLRTGKVMDAMRTKPDDPA